MCIRCEDEQTIRRIEEVTGNKVELEFSEHTCEKRCTEHALDIQVVDDIPQAECIRCGKEF